MKWPTEKGALYTLVMAGTPLLVDKTIQTAYYIVIKHWIEQSIIIG